MKHLVSSKRFGFRRSVLHRRREPHPVHFLRQRSSFWIASFSVLAFLVGNMVGQHGWYLFWKSVLGRTDDSLIVYTGTVPPITRVPDYERWALLGGVSEEHTYRQVPADLLIDLPRYDQRTMLQKGDASTSAGVYSIGHRGSYATGAENSGSHPGVDIRVPIGTPVLSITDGIVDAIKWDAGGFGHVVVIRHPNVPDPLNLTQTTTLFSVYAHLSAVLVEEGTLVKKGEQIAFSGNSGNVSGPHLHFQIDRADAPWHPYWPFVTREYRDAGYTFSEAVDKGLGSDNVLKYTVHSMLYAQANYTPLEPRAATATAVAGVSEAVESAPQLSPLKRLLKRREERRSARLERLIAAREERLMRQLTIAESEPIVAVEVAFTDASIIAPPPQEITRVEVQHDGKFGDGVEEIDITLFDEGGNLLLMPQLPRGELSLRAGYGEATFQPGALEASDFHQGRARIMMQPLGKRTIVIEVQGLPFAVLSDPLIYKRSEESVW